jgi:hypothetical protein
MNEQDRLVEVLPLRLDVDESDVDAIRRKMPELGDAADMVVLHEAPANLTMKLTAGGARREVRRQSEVANEVSQSGMAATRTPSIWWSRPVNTVTPIRANAAPSATLPPAPAQAKRALDATRPSA